MCVVGSGKQLINYCVGKWFLLATIPRRTHSGLFLEGLKIDCKVDPSLWKRGGGGDVGWDKICAQACG